MSANDALLVGTPEERITGALEDALGGSTLPEVMHLTGLCWDDAYAALQRLLGQRVVHAVQGKDRYSQGEKVTGAARYKLRRYGRV